MKQPQGVYPQFIYWLNNHLFESTNLQTRLLSLLLTIIFMLATPPVQASEFTQLIQHKKSHKSEEPQQSSLGNDGAQDNQGKAITPSQSQNAFEYSADEMQLDRPQTAQLSPSNSVSKTKNSNTKMATANDPSCRWLANRIRYLKKHIDLQQAIHHQTELGHRQTEWDCMSCSTTGPTQAERSSCQYKR
ncbi:hypothetical protein L2735_10985 [Shewanella olleyana]|uniref:hypothetical protein n=1 Tax=Shewanella olleyana TaxID=135626 RepID=UPI00200DFC87|nr:hypothetical protein [Shewanella olleyana]MCL1067329.1 hypothetical protein [Shewanella olleyana]